jgi:glycosyltransferase involved in cell wall biosynthesis
MAAFNAEKTVAETLQSLIDQTYRDREIIVTNDGSRDSTPKILDDFAHRYPGLVG